MPTWLWVVLMIGSALLALPMIVIGTILILTAPEIAADGTMSISEARLFSTFCCLVPGLLLGSGAVASAVQIFRGEQ